jgi:hypothetical protein
VGALRRRRAPILSLFGIFYLILSLQVGPAYLFAAGGLWQTLFAGTGAACIAAGWKASSLRLREISVALATLASLGRGVAVSLWVPGSDLVGITVWSYVALLQVIVWTSLRPPSAVRSS